LALTTKPVLVLLGALDLLRHVVSTDFASREQHLQGRVHAAQRLIMDADPPLAGVWSAAEMRLAVAEVSA
jgi:hypothetical protein